jgi:hypothetical protein
VTGLPLAQSASGDPGGGGLKPYLSLIKTPAGLLSGRRRSNLSFKKEILFRGGLFWEKSVNG